MTHEDDLLPAAEDDTRPGLARSADSSSDDNPHESTEANLSERIPESSSTTEPNADNRPEPFPGHKAGGRSLAGILGRPWIWTLLLAALVAAGVVFWLARERLQTESLRAAMAYGTGWQSSVTDLAVRGDSATLQSRLNDLQLDPRLRYVWLANTEGEPWIHNFSPAPDPALTRLSPPPNPRQEVTLPTPSGRQETLIDLSFPLLEGELGYLHLGISLADAERDAALLAGAVAAILLLFTVFGSIWSRSAAKRRLRPLLSVAHSLESASAGDYSNLVNEAARGEVGATVEALNRALLRLREAGPSAATNGRSDAPAGVESSRPQQPPDLPVDPERLTVASRNGELISLVDLASKLAAGKLRQLAPVQLEPAAPQYESLNRLSLALGHIAANTAETVIEARAAAEVAGQGATELRRQAQIQGAVAPAGGGLANGDQVAHIAQSMRQVSDHAAASAEAARQTVVAAQGGRQAVQRSLDGMQRIRRQVQTISQRIKSLGDRSLEVSEVVDTMTTISSQTHLLSLNAAIEASGAGQEGARFAVVAEEVRRLAEDSSRASKRIASLIRAIQTEVQDAVVAMEKGTQEVESGYRVSQEADERLQEIGRHSDSSAQLARQIADNAGGHAGAIAQVAQAVQPPGTANLPPDPDAANRALALADRLQQHAERLQRILGSFELP